MSEQLPFVWGSSTSQAAAESVSSDAARLRLRVYEAIARKGKLGATDEEVQKVLAMGGNTERPRRRELEMRGLVRDSGLRRQTESGRMAVVWVVTHED